MGILQLAAHVACPWSGSCRWAIGTYLLGNLVTPCETSISGMRESSSIAQRLLLESSSFLTSPDLLAEERQLPRIPDVDSRSWQCVSVPVWARHQEPLLSRLRTREVTSRLLGFILESWRVPLETGDMGKGASGGRGRKHLSVV